ncbi:MAG: DUF3078 domain-containing protein [Ginsengibacter sp.]
MDKYIFYKKGLFLLLCSIFFFAFKGISQDRTVIELRDKSRKNIKRPEFDSGQLWRRGGVFNLNIGQGSQKNWSAGGENFSFTINSYLGLHAFYKREKYSWDNTLDLNYGLVNTSSKGTRKNDDRIDVLSKVGYELASKLSFSALVNFHSQFSKGYKYSEKAPRELLSNFLAPGYLLFSLGLDYKPTEGLSIFVSPITSRWIFVVDDSLSAKGAYGVNPGDYSKNEIGAFAQIKYLKKITQTINYNGRIDLFSNYGHNPQNVDIMMNNKFTGKFSKILSANLALDLIYDDDVKLFGKNNDSPAWQLKSLFGVGLSVNF